MITKKPRRYGAGQRFAIHDPPSPVVLASRCRDLARVAVVIRRPDQLDRAEGTEKRRRKGERREVPLEGT